MLAWAVWWGGLSFYAVVVVPVGTEVIGSVEQGFITQRVTQWHNALSVLFTICVLVEAFLRRSRALCLIGITLAVIDMGLIFWHIRLTNLMDFQQQTVPARFYGEHAVYLWITAAEWVLGIATPKWLFRKDSTAAPISEHR